MLIAHVAPHIASCVDALNKPATGSHFTKHAEDGMAFVSLYSIPAYFHVPLFAVPCLVLVPPASAVAPRAGHLHHLASYLGKRNSCGNTATQPVFYQTNLHLSRRTQHPHGMPGDN